jgi:hypothetical protein
MEDRIKHRKLRHLWYSSAGLFALLWILLRSGANPKRLSYPCQQAAIPIAFNWLLAAAAFLGGSLLLRKITRFAFPILIFSGIVFFVMTETDYSDAFTRFGANPPVLLPVWEVQNPVSKVFIMDSVPATSGSLAAGDSTVPNSYLTDPGIDTMLMMMQSKGISFYRTPATPNGIVGSDNVVIIKGNFQWTSRNTTSADRIKGVIWKILNHPGGFTGEIMICDNTQDIGTGINQQDNNSEDVEQSIIDVVNTFHAKHYAVGSLDWRIYWDVVVNEYSYGNYASGYVYDSVSKISYPKFKTPNNCYVSIRYGIWDSVSSQYDTSKLCIIDFPVLKAHSMAGATIGIKNWIGVLTTAYSTQRYGSWNAMHSSYFFSTYALVARVLAATFPRLTIVDADWTTRQGPSNLTYIQHTSWLAASTDPAAVSWYTAKFMLTPIAISPNQTNPDLTGSAYRNCLTNWVNYLRNTAGLPCTKDSAEISVYNRSVLTSLPEKEHGSIPWEFNLQQNYPNPFNPLTKIRFRVPQLSRVNSVSGSGIFVELKVYDALGREIVNLVNKKLSPGSYEVEWNAGEFPSGIYFCRLSSGDFMQMKKMMLVK